jgi:hypothetical protein
MFYKVRRDEDPQLHHGYKIEGSEDDEGFTIMYWDSNREYVRNDQVEEISKTEYDLELGKIHNHKYIHVLFLNEDGSNAKWESGRIKKIEIVNSEFVFTVAYFDGTQFRTTLQNVKYRFLTKEEFDAIRLEQNSLLQIPSSKKRVSRDVERYVDAESSVPSTSKNHSAVEPLAKKKKSGRSNWPSKTESTQKGSTSGPQHVHLRLHNPQTFEDLLLSSDYVSRETLHSAMSAGRCDIVEERLKLHLDSIKQFKRPYYSNFPDQTVVDDLTYVVHEFAKIQSILNEPFKGVSLIQQAINSNNAKCLDLLIQSKANIDDTQAKNMSALHYAIEKDSGHEIFDIIFKHNPDMEQVHSLKTCLGHAIDKQNVSVTRLLIQKGADVNKPQTFGVPCIVNELLKYESNMLDILLEYEHDMKKVYRAEKLIINGNNIGAEGTILALYYAYTSNFRFDILDLFLKQGADINTKYQVLYGKPNDYNVGGFLSPPVIESYQRSNYNVDLKKFNKLIDLDTRYLFYRGRMESESLFKFAMRSFITRHMMVQLLDPQKYDEKIFEKTRITYLVGHISDSKDAYRDEKKYDDPFDLNYLYKNIHHKAISFYSDLFSLHLLKKHDTPYLNLFSFVTVHKKTMEEQKFRECVQHYVKLINAVVDQKKANLWQEKIASLLDESDKKVFFENIRIEGNRTHTFNMFFHGLWYKMLHSDSHTEMSLHAIKTCIEFGATFGRISNTAFQSFIESGEQTLYERVRQTPFEVFIQNFLNRELKRRGMIVCSGNGTDADENDCIIDPVSMGCINLKNGVEYNSLRSGKPNSMCYEHGTLQEILNRGNGKDPITKEDVSVAQVNTQVIRNLLNCFALDPEGNKIDCDFDDTNQPCYMTR